jgi:hypothetical protein
MKHKKRMKLGIKTLLNEAVVKILNENRLQHLITNYTGKDAKFRISPEQLLQIIQADPTTRPENPTKISDVQKPGNYVQWMLNMLRQIWPKKDEKGNVVMDKETAEKIHFFFEDIYRISDALTKFDVMKQKHKLPEGKKDINQIRSIQELRSVTKNFDLNAVDTEKQQRVVHKERSKEMKVEYEDSRWLVVTPLTFEASRSHFADPVTNWCTASTNGRGRFEGYSRENPLYAIIDKSLPAPKPNLEGKPVLQIHFGSHTQFKDENDDEILVKPFFDGQDGLKNWLHPIYRKALVNHPFELSDRLWQNYIGIYGATPEIMVILDENFKKLMQRKEVLISDNNSTSSGIKAEQFISMLDYEEVLNKIFKYVPNDVTKFEIKFENYRGQGYPVPESVGKLKNCKFFVFMGFASSLPDVMGSLPAMTFLCVNKSRYITTLPESLCQSNLDVLNYMECENIRHIPPCIEERAAAETLLLVQ